MRRFRFLTTLSILVLLFAACNTAKIVEESDLNTQHHHTIDKKTIEVLVPLYLDPNIPTVPDIPELTSISLWEEIINTAENSDVEITVIIGPSNNSHLGTGYPFDQPLCEWGSYNSLVMESLEKAGIDTVGYVRTAYNNKYDDPDAFPYFPYTSKAAIKANIDRFKNCKHLDGIFFDEVELSTKEDVKYYQDLCRYAKVKAKFGPGKYILNQGTNNILPIKRNFCNTVVVSESTPDVWKTFELEHYQGPRQNHPATSVMVHTTNSTDSSELEEIQNNVNLAYERSIDYIYLTDDTLYNPWDSLGTAGYWDSFINYLEQSNP